VAKKFQYKWQKLGFNSKKEYDNYIQPLRREARKIMKDDIKALSEKTGLSTTLIHVHHIIPLSDGGSNLPENLVVCTRDEHYKKYHPDMLNFFPNDCSLEKHPLWIDLNDVKEDIIKLRYELNTLEEIVEKLKLDCSTTPVRKRLILWLGDKEADRLTNKIQKKGSSQPGKKNAAYKEINTDKVLKLHNEGLSLTKIGKELDVTSHVIKNRLIDILGDDFKFNESSSNYIPYNKDDFLFYYMQGYDIKDITDKLGLSDFKIKNILKEIYGSNYDINDRPIMWSDRIIIDKREPKQRKKNLTKKFNEFELPYYYATLPTFDVANKYVGIEIKKGDDFIGSILGTSRLRAQLARIIEAPQPVKMILIIDPKYKSHYSKISASSIAGMKASIAVQGVSVIELSNRYAYEMIGRLFMKADKYKPLSNKGSKGG
jgi:hypothetical protein